MKLAIDASNILLGGGHLRNVLRSCDPRKHGFSEVHVFGAKSTSISLITKCGLSCIDNRCVRAESFRVFADVLFPKLLSIHDVDDFLPGGFLLRAKLPVVNMFQNMQVFEAKKRPRAPICTLVAPPYSWPFTSILSNGQSAPYF